MSTRQNYLANAAIARAEADAAVLDNVRERCLRSEAAWIAMATRAQETEDLRARRLAEIAVVAV
jgi:hypothetical protein